ncbi:MAG: hypothetical protein IIY48_05330 [Clostridia bacterium]|nr:hypothetical protein [Clostridia bacterium]
MADNEKEFTAGMEDDLEILPDGWGEGDDFFNVDSWGKDASADESEGSDSQQDLNDIFAEANTDEGTTTADEDDSEDSSETEEPTTQDGPGKLKFKATVDHEDLDVELDETELPALYQKAQVTDRVQAKLANMQPIYNQAVRTAKILGYDTPEEMLKAAEDSYRDGEIEKLVNEGTNKDVAEDYIRRKMQDAEVKEDTKPAEEAPKGRDFKAEVEALLDIRPDLKKPGTKLPEEVTEECVKSGRPLAVVYLEYEAKQEKAKYDALLKENKKLKQNAEAASRAPVRGVSRGGPVKDKSNDDPFLAGFNADD